MSLMDTFNQMVEEATETEKVAGETQETQEVDERMEVLNKYANWADETLAAEYGEGEYTAEDVEKLAMAKLEEDAKEEQNREKVAEYFEAGQIMYAGFKAAAEADEN